MAILEVGFCTNTNFLCIALKCRKIAVINRITSQIRNLRFEMTKIGVRLKVKWYVLFCYSLISFPFVSKGFVSSVRIQI